MLFSCGVFYPAQDRQKETVRLIIGFEDADQATQVAEELRRLSDKIGHALVYIRPMAGSMHVIELRKVSRSKMPRILQILRSDPGVVFVHRDYKVELPPKDPGGPPVY